MKDRRVRRIHIEEALPIHFDSIDNPDHRVGKHRDEMHGACQEWHHLVV